MHKDYGATADKNNIENMNSTNDIQIDNGNNLNNGQRKDSNRQDSMVEKRKRVNRIKTAIILIVVVLLILPTILCIIMGFRLNRLQEQVDRLAVLHNQYELSEDRNDNYVYAAVKPTGAAPEDVSPAEGSDTQYSGQTEEALSASEGSQSNNTDQTGFKENKESNKVKEGIYEGKKVYLTFDDGPSIYTGKILDTLSDYDIKATFFVIGKTDSSSKELYKRIVAEGHTLGMHSFSHQYKIIYNSVEDFDKDFTKLRKLLYDTTGYLPSIYRFPGGSDNMVNNDGMDKFIRYLNNASVVYFDWNVENGDAKNINYSKDELVKNVLNGVALKERAIVLMHDTQAKKKTVDSLPKLIEALIEGGAQILPLDKDVTPIQMINADSVK